MGIAVLLSFCLLSCMCCGGCYADDDNQYIKTIFQRLKHIIDVWKSPHISNQASGNDTNKVDLQSSTSTTLKATEEHYNERSTTSSIGGEQSIVTTVNDNSSKAGNVKAPDGYSVFNKTDLSTGTILSNAQLYSVQTIHSRQGMTNTEQLNNIATENGLSQQSQGTKYVGTEQTANNNQTINQSNHSVKTINQSNHSVKTINQSNHSVNRKVSEEQQPSANKDLITTNSNTQMNHSQTSSLERATLSNSVTSSKSKQSGNSISPDRHELFVSPQDKKVSLYQPELSQTKIFTTQNLTRQRKLQQRNSLDKTRTKERINTGTSHISSPDFTNGNVNKNTKADMTSVHKKSTKEHFSMDTSQNVSPDLSTGNVNKNTKAGRVLNDKINKKNTKEHNTIGTSQIVSPNLNTGNVNKNTKAEMESILNDKVNRYIETQKSRSVNQFTIDNQIFRVKIPREQLPRGQISDRHLTNNVIHTKQKTEGSKVDYTQTPQNLMKINNLPVVGGIIPVQAMPENNKFSLDQSVQNKATFTINKQKGTAFPSPDYSTLNSINNLQQGIVFSTHKNGIASEMTKQTNNNPTSKVVISSELSGQVRSSVTGRVNEQTITHYEKGSIVSPSHQPDQVLQNSVESVPIISPSRQPDQVLQNSVESVPKVGASVVQGNLKVYNAGLKKAVTSSVEPAPNISGSVIQGNMRVNNTGLKKAVTSSFVIGGNPATTNNKQDIVPQYTAKTNEKLQTPSGHYTSMFSQNNKPRISGSIQGHSVKNGNPNYKTVNQLGQSVNNKKYISKAGQVGPINTNTVVVDLPPISPIRKGFVPDASLGKMSVSALNAGVANGIRNVFKIKTYTNINQSKSDKIKGNIKLNDTLKYVAAGNTKLQNNEKDQLSYPISKKTDRSFVPLTSYTESNKDKNKANNPKSGVIVVPNDPKLTMTAGFVPQKSSMDPFKNFGKNQIKTPSRSKMISITPIKTYELKLKKNDTQGLMTSKVTFRAGHDGGKNMRRNALKNGSLTGSANDILNQQPNTANNFSVVSSKLSTIVNLKPTTQNSFSKEQTRGRGYVKPTAGKIQTFTINKKQNQKGHFSFKSTALPKSTGKLVVPATQVHVITKEPLSNSSNIEKGNMNTKTNAGVRLTKTNSSGYIVPSPPTKMSPVSNGGIEGNHQTEMADHRSFPSSDVIIKIRVQSKTQSKSTGKAPGTVDSTSHLTDLKNGDSVMRQSITNFGNNRLLYNEFRKYKLLGKIRRKRSVLSEPLFMNNIIDKPVKVFSNSYDTIIGNKNNAKIGTDPGSTNNARIVTDLGYNARIGTDNGITNNAMLGTRGINVARMSTDLGNINEARIGTDLGKKHNARMETGNTNNARMGTDLGNKKKPGIGYILGNTNNVRIGNGNTNNARIGAGNTNNVRIGTGKKNNARIGTGNTNNARIGTGNTNNARIGTGNTNNARIGTGNTINARIRTDLPIWLKNKTSISENSFHARKSLDNTVLKKDNYNKVKSTGSTKALKYNTEYKYKYKMISGGKLRRRRNHKKRHISDSLFQRILSKGLPVFSKKRKTFVSLKNNKPFRVSAFNKKLGNKKKGLRINFNTAQQSKRKYSNMHSSKYHDKKDSSFGQLDKPVDFQTLLLHGNEKDLNSHYRQHFVQVDSVLNEPSAKNMLSQPPSITNKQSDFTSSHMDHISKKSDSSHNIVDDNNNDKQSNTVAKHLALSNLKDKPAPGLSMHGIYLSHSDPLTIVQKNSQKDIVTKIDDATNKGLSLDPVRNVKYTQQRHHDSIINMPHLLSGLSHVNDIVSANSFSGYKSSSPVGGKIKTPVVNPSVTDSPSVNDVVTYQFEKPMTSELPHAITLSDIKIVPGGCIIDGKFHRYEDLPKFIQDYYDTKTQNEHVKLSLGDIEHVLNDYTDNKGSISQGFARDYPVLEVIKGQDASPFSIQLPGDTNGYDILIDPHLHEGSLELAVLHANHIKGHGNKLDIGGQDSLNDMHINQQHILTASDNDQPQKTSLRWGDGIFDKAGTGLASLSDYHLGSEVRVGSSLSLGQVIGKVRDYSSYNLASDHTRGSDILSLSPSSNMKGPDHVYFNPMSPKLHVSSKSEISPPPRQSLVGSSVMSDMIVSSDDKPIGLLSQQLNSKQGYNKLNNGGTFVNDLTPSKKTNKKQIQTTETNTHIDVIDRMNNNEKLNHYKSAVPPGGVTGKGIKGLNPSKYNTDGTPTLDGLIPTDYQLKDSFASKFKLGEILTKDFSGFNLTPKSDTFSGFKTVESPSIPVRLSGQYDLETVMNNIFTSPKRGSRNQIQDIFGK